MKVAALALWLILLACNSRGQPQQPVADPVADSVAVLMQAMDSMLGVHAWRRDSSTDEMDGEVTVHIRRATAAIDTTSYGERSRLVLMCRKTRALLAVIPRFALAGSYQDGNQVRLRFDNDPVVTEKWTVTDDGKSIAPLDPLPLTRQLINADTLRIELKTLSEGTVVERFAVGGLDAELAAGLGSCKIKDRIAADSLTAESRRVAKERADQDASRRTLEARRHALVEDSLRLVNAGRKTKIDETSTDSTLPWVTQRLYQAVYYRNRPDCSFVRSLSHERRYYLKSEADAELIGLIKTSDPKCW